MNVVDFVSVKKIVSQSICENRLSLNSFRKLSLCFFKLISNVKLYVCLNINFFRPQNVYFDYYLFLTCLKCAVQWNIQVCPEIRSATKVFYNRAKQRSVWCLIYMYLFKHTRLLFCVNICVYLKYHVIIFYRIHCTKWLWLFINIHMYVFKYLTLQLLHTFVLNCLYVNINLKCKSDNFFMNFRIRCEICLHCAWPKDHASASTHWNFTVWPISTDSAVRLAISFN